MGELIRKELKSFFAALSGYVVLGFFLVVNGLFLWVIPGMYNIPESGMADLQPFFSLAPMLYLFLVPVVCMRLFAEEKRAGTLELLFTRPVSIAKIVWAKYLAGFFLVILSILPTLIYPISLYFLSQPEGNIDTGGIIGSYIGLIFLSGIYVAAGVWASAVTDNQIVAFLYAMVCSFLLFAGFDFISEVGWFENYQNLLQQIGIHYHYEPMSRGVIALSDIVYFISVILFFLWLTIRRFHTTRWRWIYVLPLLIIVNIIASGLYWRVDITNDKRYTLSDNTKQLLRQLDRGVGVDIFLAGNLPAGIQKLQYATTRMLEEFRRITGNKLRYTLVDPADIRDVEEKKQLVQYLASRGIMPVNLNRTTTDERLQQQIIFPGLIVYDDSTEVSISLLQNVPGYAPNDNINHSIEALEYELTKALRLLTRTEKKSVAFLTGHGELPYEEIVDMAKTLLYYYNVDIVSADSLALDLERYKALIIAKPTKDFSEKDKYVIDQYIMRGGRVLWCVDEVDVHDDVLMKQETSYAVYRPLNIEDMLFKYGIRINPDILLDGNCVLVPVITGMNGTEPQYTPGPWYYSPLLLPSSLHPVTAGLQPVRMNYANTIDTVGGKDGLKKTILLASSKYSASMKTPCPITLSITEEKMTEERFNKSYLPVAVMIEGEFSSLFRYSHRVDNVLEDTFLPRSVYNKMIVISDGDVIANRQHGIGKNARVVPLGYDEYSGRVYGNKDFLLNCVNMLCDDEGWMQLRGRSLTMYLIDKTRLKSELLEWQIINLFVPLLCVLTGGGLLFFFRRRKYRASV
ncbi:gliding motility-associated ABC transporter substrate-binding protein GldG [Odoribacter lunatus]|uniref:gliding motility-associated ABC transporter substrate-binding protein GldG n=1 Tax=Odoribacter lunatus TaxID=2941335 RepID=UPI00204078E9|nr:gliding motility-associated ABC transporter substrate-binding protein GldG [Odoribacter lunatus]